MGAASATETQRTAARSGLLPRLALTDVSYGALVVLVFALPFEATQRPLLRTPLITLTDLGAVFYVVAGLAALTLLRPGAWRLVLARRVPLALLLAVLVVAGASAAVGSHPLAGLKWTFALALGGLLWLAIPIWMRDAPDRRLRTAGVALVAGATISALAGLAEMRLGASVDAGALAWFKEQPSLVGPYLRLSGTFDYANTAAGYLAMVAPFAVAGAAGAWRTRSRWILAWGAALGTIGAALLLTYSRGGLLGLSAGLAVLGWAAVRHGELSGRRLWLPGALAVCALAAVEVRATAVSGPGLLRLTTQSDMEWYQAGYAGTPPPVARPGTLLIVPVTVRNRGAVTWRAGGRSAFHLSYHWLRPNGTLLITDGLRTPLPHPLGPGDQTTVPARVLTPRRPGEYRFAWDMVEEHLLWFDLHDGTAQASPVRVTGRADKVPVAAPAQSVSLSESPVQPERSVLWAAALRMIRAHPLLGIGPNGYRLTYGRYERPPVTRWDTRIFANSLPLELAADLGLPGAVLFLAFVGAAVWPLGVRLVSGTGFGVWEAALAAAVAVLLAHGLVDYLLGSHAIDLLFWIVLGLAASRSTSNVLPGRG